jgi:hypothetical protein
MSEQVYKEMVDVMSKRGLVFGGMDIPEFYRVAKALFTLDEAEINNAMPPQAFTAAELAEIMGRDEAELAVTLKQMADKGLCRTHVEGNLRLFRAAPFVPGIFEFVMMRGTATERDKEMARYIKEYKDLHRRERPGRSCDLLLPPRRVAARRRYPWHAHAGLLLLWSDRRVRGRVSRRQEADQAGGERPPG